MVTPVEPDRDALVRALRDGARLRLLADGVEVDLPEPIRRFLSDLVDDDRIGIAEAAERLAVTPGFLTGLLDAGTIPSVEMQGVRLLRSRDLEVYRNERDLRRRAVLNAHFDDLVATGAYE